MNHFDVHLKLTQHCKSTLLQYKMKIFEKTWWDRRSIWEARMSQVIPINSAWSLSVLKTSPSTLAILPDVETFRRGGKMFLSHINLYFGLIFILMHLTYWEPHWTYFPSLYVKGLLKLWINFLFLKSWPCKADIWASMVKEFTITFWLMSLSYSPSK